MNPSVYFYNEKEEEFELYLGECSTIEALSLFEEKAEIIITSMGATCYKNYGWATEDEFPKMKNVGEAMLFLRSQKDIGLVDFEALLPGIGSMSTHDDREFHFVTRKSSECIRILKNVITGQYKDMLINKLLNNPGLYITYSQNGVVSKYSSFDEYTEKNT